MYKLILLGLFILSAVNASDRINSLDIKTIQTKIKILQLFVSDQTTRNELVKLQRIKNGVSPWFVKNYLTKVDQGNFYDIKKTVDEFERIPARNFEKNYICALCLLVQHCDRDVKLQKRFLNHLIKLNYDNEFTQQVAYLDDRISVKTRKMQHYGTQGQCIRKGLWVPFSIIDEKNINVRRSAMNLVPLNEYRNFMNSTCL